MLFSLFQRLAGVHGQRTDRSGAASRRFVPGFTALEDRSVPSGVPLHETLTVVGVSPTGVVHYEGQASHFGRVTADLNPDNTFVKYASNGDTVTGFVTHATETTGTITYNGGTGRFEGATGLTSYVISVDPKTGATTVDVSGTISYGKAGAGVKALPFKITGGGPAPNGLPLVPGGTGPHSATGKATQLGKYTGEGTFEMGSLNISPTGAVTGTFQGTMVFVAANGDRLAFVYGAGTSGVFTGQMSADGTAVENVEFDAIFTPDPANSTGRFAQVTGGGFRMIAKAESISLISAVQGFTAPFDYTWSGEGTLEYGKGKK
jgi:hypothetical protein